MRNLVFLRSSDYLRKRVLKDAEKFVGHFAFCPQETTADPAPTRSKKRSHRPHCTECRESRILHPIVASRMRSAAGVVGPLAASARMRHCNFAAFFSVMTRSTAAGIEHITFHGEELVRIDMVRLDRTLSSVASLGHVARQLLRRFLSGCKSQCRHR